MLVTCTHCNTCSLGTQCEKLPNPCPVVENTHHWNCGPSLCINFVDLTLPDAPILAVIKLSPWSTVWKDMNRDPTTIPSRWLHVNFTCICCTLMDSSHFHPSWNVQAAWDFATYGQLIATCTNPTIPTPAPSGLYACWPLLSTSPIMLPTATKTLLLKGNNGYY